MAARPRRPGRANRSSGFVYTALSAVMILVIATLAITASQTPPPAIAELSPTPQKQIKDAPQEQSSELGSADGGSGLGGILPTTTTVAATGPTTTLPTKRVLRQRKCVGNPPRQTEDPQSPACVLTWDGSDNGGATTKGVTGEEIRVVFPGDGTTTNRELAALEAYFNSRFEFYGRRLRIVTYKQAGNFTTCQKMLADAIRVDEEIGAFASLRYSIQDGREGCYYDELARRKIVSVQTSGVGIPSQTEAHMSETPYQWNYYAPIDTMLANLGEVVCKELKASGPTHAGPPQNAALQRKFGLVIDSTSNGVPPPDPRPLLTKARACGLDFGTPIELDVPSQDYSLAKSAVLKLKDNGATSVVCLCGFDFMNGMMAQSTQEAYFPEWIAQDYRAQTWDDGGGHQWTRDHADHVFGIRGRNKSLPRAQMPYWAAVREADPTYPTGIFQVSTEYWSMLLLASGIQAAGPRLTPETFANGLQRAVFPNPGCGGPPFYQACVGFKGDHSMVDDFTLVWYDQNGTSDEVDAANGNLPYAKNAGTYCYVDGGRRYKAGEWPTRPDPFFRGSCR
jgi:hypothetical protein